jgi:hypothetical protein
MIVASMIEAVIKARVAPALRSPPLTRVILACHPNAFLLAPRRPPLHISFHRPAAACFA